VYVVYLLCLVFSSAFFVCLFVCVLLWWQARAFVFFCPINRSTPNSHFLPIPSFYLTLLCVSKQVVAKILIGVISTNYLPSSHGRLMERKKLCILRCVMQKCLVVAQLATPMSPSKNWLKWQEVKSPFLYSISVPLALLMQAI
jgi:hypothetical protein